MRDRPLILAVDDTPENLEILQLRLETKGYEVATASDGEEAILRTRELLPDLILLDIMMPKLDGIAVVRVLKQDPKLRSIPVILVTAKAESKDIVAGLDAGGDDYLTKPFDHSALLARVRSMLRQKSLHDTVQEQAAALREQARRLAEWNVTLEQRVAAQVEEIERIGRLRRFLPPQIADLIASSEHQELLASHRRDVTVVFCDLRGFTAFAEVAEPEEVMSVLREYHAALGDLIFRYEGTLERFMGDGILVLFNDPVLCPDHTARAVRMALEMRDRIASLSETWRRAGHSLGFGIGVSRGYATLGKIGFDQRLDYAVIGTVPNLASRLCAEAKAGQILISQPAYVAIEALVQAVPVGALELKGLHRPVLTYDVINWKDGSTCGSNAAL